MRLLSPTESVRLTGFTQSVFVRPIDGLILLIVWVGVNGGLYAHYGVKVVNDSPRYLEYAQKIIYGSGWYEPHNFWYVGYVLFITMVKGVFATNEAIIAAQVIVHGLASVALYRTSYHLFASRRAALTTALLFLGWIELPTWNFYILAESWYVSLLCFVLYCITSFTGSLRRLIFTTLLVLLTFFTKPTGIAILLAYGVFLISYYQVRVRKLTPERYLLAILGLLSLYGLVNQMLSSFVLIENYATGEVVYGMSTTEGYAGKEQLVLFTEDLLLPSTNLDPIPRLLLFITNNPTYFITLSLTKAAYFLGHVRPYYSWLHNAFIVVTLYPLYLLASKTLWQGRVIGAVRSSLLTFILVHLTAIMFTSVDWDGRFLMPLLPTVFLLGVGGASRMYNSVIKKLFSGQMK